MTAPFAGQAALELDGASPLSDAMPSADGLSLFVTIQRLPAPNQAIGLLGVARRNSTDATFGPIEELGLDHARIEIRRAWVVSDDELTIYFAREIVGQLDIMVATRFVQRADARGRAHHLRRQSPELVVPRWLPLVLHECARRRNGTVRSTRCMPHRPELPWRAVPSLANSVSNDAS